MEQLRSPLKQVNENSQIYSETENKNFNLVTHENHFLKKKIKEMQRIINEMSQNNSKNSHSALMSKYIS